MITYKDLPVSAPLRTFLFTSLFCLIVAFPAQLSFAQGDTTVLDPYPLRPADTSSPRATLRSFNKSSNLIIRAWRSGASHEAVLSSRRRVFETFDFSQLAERGRLASQIEATLLLKEVLERIELPPDEEIPGDEAVKDRDKPIHQWTIPNTQITIAKIDEGPREGQFLFSAETVRRLKEFYQRSKQLPYRSSDAIGIYEDVTHSPGFIVPRSWANALPTWSKTVMFEAALWQWIGLAIVVVAAILIIRLLLRWGNSWDERHRTSGSLTKFGAPLSILASVLVVYASRLILLNAVGIIKVWIAISSVVWVLIFVGIGWFVLVISGRLADATNNIRHIKEGGIDGQLVQTMFRLASLVIVVFVFIYAADFVGIPLTPVLAGLGVGGIAIALAVRPTLENIIGGLTLFADKPVRIGDFCRFGEDYGTVEEIGLRSTRLRRLDDTLVSIPNGDFSQKELTNFTRRRRWLYRTTLGLRYETTPEQLRYAIAKLREMLNAHPKISPDTLHVRFHDFGAYSLDVEVFAYIRAREWLNYRAIREDINLRVIEIVQEAGTGFAFPSQTAYLGRDQGLDTDRAQAAEAQVEKWRSRGQLPFPEFDDDTRTQKQDTIAYPPKGSPDYKPSDDQGHKR